MLVNYRLQRVRAGAGPACLATSLLFRHFALAAVRLAPVERTAPVFAIMWFDGAVLLLVCFAVICLATAGLIDRGPQPTWPRPMAYLNLWVALSGGGGGIAVFFAHDPSAWNGLIGFYMPLTVLAVWVLVTTRVPFGAMARQAADGAAKRSAAGTLRPDLVGAH